MDEFDSRLRLFCNSSGFRWSPGAIGRRLCGLVVVLCLAARTDGQSASSQKGHQIHQFKPIDVPVLVNPAPARPATPTEMSLRTSWIPGEKGKGSLRYQLQAFGKSLEPDTPDTSRYINRLSACMFTLELYDSDDFILRRIPVNFRTNVTESGNANGLAANDAVIMNLLDYKSLIDGGHFNMSWTCPEGG